MKMTSKRPSLATIILFIGILLLLSGCTKPPIASFSPDKTIIATGNTVQFTDQSTGEATSWAWDFGDGSNSTEKNPSHIFTTKGKYQVSLTASNKGGGTNSTVEVTILQPPTSSFTVDKNVALIGDKYTCSDQSSGDISSYQWEFGDGTSSNETNPSHSYSDKGDYTITLKVSNEVSNSIKTQQVKVIRPAHAEFSSLFGGGKAKISAGIKFDDKSTGDIDSWSWDFGDGAKSSERTPVHYYKERGVYTVTLTVGNAAVKDTMTKKDFITIQTLTLSKVTMCSDVKLDGQYTVQPGATYRVGDRVWGYYEIRGFEQHNTTNGFEIWINFSNLKIKNPDGSVSVDLSDITEFHSTEAEKAGYLWYRIPIGVVAASEQKGIYAIEIKVIDKLTGDSDTAFGNFVVQ